MGKAKEAVGLEHHLWLAGFVVSLALSMILLAKAVQTLPIGTAYPIWTGIGAVGAFVVGIVFLGEQVSAMRIAAAVLIVSGLVMMKLASH